MRNISQKHIKQAFIRQQCVVMQVMVIITTQENIEQQEEKN